MALKPIPRLILIAGIIGGAAFGIGKYMDSSPAPGAAQSAPALPGSANPGTAAPVAPQAGKNNTYAAVLESGTVRVSVQSPSKPFLFTENGTVGGFNYEFLKLLFKQAEFNQKGSEIKIDVGHLVDTYADVPKALLKTDGQGKPTVDIAIDGLTFSDEDLPGVVYSIPYVDDFGYALITGAATTIKNVKDLKGLTIGILMGDPDVKAYASAQFPGVKLLELSDASIGGQRTWINHSIKAGQVDAIIYDYPFAAAEISGTDLQFAMSKLPGSDLKYKIGVRQGDTLMLENINIAIRKAKADPQYVNLVQKYFMSANLAKVRAAEGGESFYVVKAGDTLSKIAAAVLGSPTRLGEIEARNNLPNPNLIRVGQKLVIPKV